MDNNIHTNIKTKNSFDDIIKHNNDSSNTIDGINKLINELDVETDNSINSNYFNEDEKKKINNINNFNKLIYYICLILGFYLIIVCDYNGIFTLFFEIILNLFIPYLFIPIKLFMCRNNLKNICIPLI